MKLSKAVTHRLREINNTSVVGQDVVYFFSRAVLLYRLRYPVALFYETLINVYQLFYKKLHKDCHYQEVFVQQNEKQFFCNVRFNTNHGKFMVAMFAHPEMALIEQINVMEDIFSSFQGLHLSPIPIAEEQLPELVSKLVDEMTVRNEDLKNLRLKKIINSETNKEICFHELNIRYLGDKAITIVAGFEY